MGKVRWGRIVFTFLVQRISLVGIAAKLKERFTVSPRESVEKLREEGIVFSPLVQRILSWESLPSW